MLTLSGDVRSGDKQLRLPALGNLCELTAMSRIHQPPNPPILYSFPSTNTLAESLESFIIKAQKDSLEKKGKFTIALSGGSLPKVLNRLKGNPAVKWDKWYCSSLLVLSSSLTFYPGKSSTLTNVLYPLTMMIPTMLLAKNTCFLQLFLPETYTPLIPISWMIWKNSLTLMRRSLSASLRKKTRRDSLSSISFSSEWGRTVTPLLFFLVMNFSLKKIDG